jgi:hypothetical protein
LPQNAIPTIPDEINTDPEEMTHFQGCASENSVAFAELGVW